MNTIEEPNKPEQPTAEQLLKLLDIQMAELRKKRGGTTENRTGMRVFSLCVIVFGAALALWVLMYMLDEMKPEKQEQGNESEIQSTK